MHNHDDKYPARPGFEPGTSRLQAPVNTNEPPGSAISPLDYCTAVQSQKAEIVSSGLADHHNLLI